MDLYGTFLALLVMHFVCDYALQGRVLECAKIRGGQECEGALWKHALSAHSAINAVGVALATLSPILGACEFISHWLIDYYRGEGKYNFHIDQLLHLITKIAWTAAVCLLR